MSKIAHYLQEHLTGEVMSSPDARRYFATDGSVFTVTPTVIVYPRNENDVRKTARFAWQLAERGRVLPITARGSGTDQAGAAIGSGIMLAFPAHLHKVLELDAKTGVVVVEPGINYGKLQEALHTHGRFLPPFPASIEYSTLGGAVANNSSGEKSIKYGDTRAYVRGLRVVLSNGEVIETERLSKRELNKKLGLTTFEGEIYRAVDTLLEENRKVVENLPLGVTKNSAGYDLQDIRNKDGFDLTPLFVGSQGTLGLVTEITLDTEAYNPATVLLAGFFDDIQKAEKAVLELRRLSDVPSAIEMVDEHLLNLVDKLNPNQLKDVIPSPLPKLVLLVEFDNPSEHARKALAKKAAKVLKNLATSHEVATETEAQERLWKIRRSAATVIAHSDGALKAVPIIEDGIVPLEKYGEYLEGVYKLLADNRLQAAVWGHAGDANLHLQPYLDLSQVGDRQKLFRLVDDYYTMIINLGGSTSGEHGDGRLRAPYLPKLYGPEAYELFQKVKKIFDPYGILNPGVKIDVELADIKPLLRHEYSLGAWYEHMPRT